MTDDVLPNLSLQVAPAPRRDWRIVVMAIVSGLAHVLIFALIVLLPLLKLPPPEPPPAINVELVPPQLVSSLEPSSEPPSSSQEEVSSQQPPSSAEPLSSEPAGSSAEPSSSAEPASSEQASSAEAASASEVASSQPAPPQPQSRPLIIPVGPDNASSETSTPSDASSEPESSAASAEDASSVLGTTDGDAEAAADPETATPPAIDGPLHIAGQFYASRMLSGPEMEAARKAIKELPKQRRIVQMCNLEAIGQIGRTAHLQPNALVADAFAAPVTTGLKLSVPGGAFRSGETWYGVAFQCTVAADLGSISAFSFRLSDALPGPPARFATPPKATPSP